MVELLRISDPVSLQILSDALQGQGIVCRIENTGMNALMPLPAVMDARVLVEAGAIKAAEQIAQDLELL